MQGRLEGTFLVEGSIGLLPWPQKERKLCSSQAVSVLCCLFSTVAQQRIKRVGANGPALVCVLQEFNYAPHGKVVFLLYVVALSLFVFH